MLTLFDFRLIYGSQSSIFYHFTDPFEEIHHSDMTDWERQREREEFMRAYQLYKPMSGFMASRFTRGEHEDTLDSTIIPPKTEVSPPLIVQ